MRHSLVVKTHLRAVRRFVGAVLAVTGALLLTDAAVTLAWQEPVSALITGRAQSRLGDELAAVERRFRPQPSAPDARGLVERYRRGLRNGDPVGRIELPALDRRYVLVEGTGAGPLRRGPGHYPASALPGEGRTVAIAGHRTTYLAPFRTIDRLEPADRIVVRMPYGRFEYRVERTRIVEPTAVWVTRDVGRERLVLTACHPLYSARQRIVVFARLARAGSLDGRD